MQVRPRAIMLVGRLFGAVLFAALATAPASAAPPAGFIVTNVADATYVDGIGHGLAARSNAVSVAIAAVGGLAVGSDQACGTAPAPFAIGPDALVRFTVANTGNVPDAYRVASATATAGAIDGVTFVSGSASIAANAATVSPVVQPGGTLTLMVALATARIAAGTSTQITLAVTDTAGATVNGPRTIVATACGIAERGAVIGAPGATASGPPVKLVDGLPSIAATAGAQVTYTVGFMNHGGMNALGVVLSDPLPAGIVALPATVSLDGVAVGSRASVGPAGVLTVALGTIAPGQPHLLSFAATVVSAPAPGSSLPNVATFVSADAPAVATTTATVVAGVADIVYDGATEAPIAGATVSLLAGMGGGAAPALTGPLVPPNLSDSDPFVTGGTGTYAFGLAPARTGSGTFTMLVSAPGYAARRFGLTLADDTGSATYDATLSALDGGALALPGSLALTHAASVKTAAVYGIFGNLPLFKPESIALSKTVDRAQASGGDRLVYTIAVASSADPLGRTIVVDALPRDVLYARGTALVDGTHVEPAIAGATLTWTFPTLASPHTIVFATVVAPGAVAGETLANVATATAALPGIGTGTAHASASASTAVVGGALADSNVILGRVFIDYFGDGRFRHGDLGVARARIMLEDGESVQTDADGLFSFPGVRPGMHTLELDPESLPAALQPFETRDYDDPRSPIRLVHGVFDGGLLSDVQFAVRLR